MSKSNLLPKLNKQIIREIRQNRVPIIYQIWDKKTN